MDPANTKPVPNFAVQYVKPLDAPPESRVAIPDAASKPLPKYEGA